MRYDVSSTAELLAAAMTPWHVTDREAARSRAAAVMASFLGEATRRT